MIYLYIALGVLALSALIGAGIMLKITLPISKKVYFDTLVRTSSDKWTRACSCPENEEQMEMWNTGCAWAEEHKDRMKEVEITNDGLKLVGELYDFGSEKCVIILPGRCESLMYSYYYARPYGEMGINVFLPDPRSHGNSEGKFSTLGVCEGKDVNAWARHLNENYGIKEIYLHGVCVGASTAIFAVTDENMPECIKGMVNEGCYVNFYETFKNHMIADGHPVFPVCGMVMRRVKQHTGVDIMKKCPLNYVGKVKIPTLFIFGEKDIYTVPEKSKILFNACGSKDKKIVWFPKGGHSHLRINNTEEYDNAVKEFVLSH